MNRRTFTLGAVTLLVSAACDSVPPLANTRPSVQTLGAAVLEALQRHERPALEMLALNETEFRDHVWPQLPAARPERNLPFSYIWGDLRQKSQAALSATLARHGGRRYELISVTFGRDTDYGDYRVHRDALLHVRSPDGTLDELRVCGSMIEKDGGWKVFSYVVDD